MTNRSRILIFCLAALVAIGLGAMLGVYIGSSPSTLTISNPTVPLAASTTTTSLPTAGVQVIPSTTAGPVPTTAPATARATTTALATTTTTAATVAPAKPSSIAFCGPNYDASPSEWQALASSGIGIAYPPCSSYPFGQPVPWPVAGSDHPRFVGFIPWNDPNVPHGLFDSYLRNAAAAGIKVFGFAPELWTSKSTAEALSALDALPHGEPYSLVGWVLPEEPRDATEVTVFGHLVDAMHQRGLLVHLNFATMTPEIAQASQALHPDLVSSDDYSSLDNALALDAQVQAAFPGTPRLAAVSTVQFDCSIPQPTATERAAWVEAIGARGAAVLWFTWDLPQLDQSCKGQDAGIPWTGGLFNAPLGVKVPG